MSTFRIPDEIAKTAKIMSSRLISIYSNAETSQITRILMEEVSKKTYSQLLILNEKFWNEEEKALLEDYITQLEAGKPLQHVLGKAWFYGETFQVSPAVLIPRPETEELIEMILKESRPEPPKRILDIGTGSGCIPIILKKYQPLATVSSVDVSADAQAIAKKNAEEIGEEVEFIQMDILKAGSNDFGDIDLIVSNPPYVTEKDRAEMHARVLDHEPHLALFPEGSDPLVFYRHIAREGFHWLNEGGELWFEINESLGPATQSIVEEAGFEAVELRKDLRKKDRFILARKAGLPPKKAT